MASAGAVWNLSVNLETRTATFTSGLSDAAKAARGSFGDIKDSASGMGRGVSGSMFEAREGTMLLGEEFGIHLPRALTTFVAGLGPVGEAMAAAFPFLAIIMGATLLIQHLEKIKEAGEKLTEDQEKFGTTVQNVYNKLDEKLLEAGIRADELNDNHLAALHKQLQLIDKQSMGELVSSFEEVAKAADTVFGDLKTSWYEMQVGSAGAKSALDHFKSQYESLLAQGKDKDAGDLLAGTLQSAERVLQLQKEMNSSSQAVGNSSGAEKNKAALTYLRDAEELKKNGVGTSEKEIAAQEALVAALRAQVEVQGKVGDLKKLQDSNAVQTTQKTVDSDADALANQHADAYKKEIDEQDKLDEQRYQNAVANIQQGEKQKLAATEEGSAERLAAIDAALKEENAKGLQDTGFYKELLTQRVQTARQMATEEAQAQAEGKKEASDHELKMDELAIQAKKESAALKISALSNAAQAQLESELATADAEFKAKADANERDIAALNQHGKDYENKLKVLQDREKELVRAHENELAAIKDKAQEQQNARILSGMAHLRDMAAQGLAETLMRHQAFGKMIVSIGDQVATGMMQNAIKSVLADDFTKERDAAAAARRMFLAGSQFPFPANVILAPALAAGAFAAVMAFDTGGLVPGTANFDSVPAMLKPGEAVIPKEMTERLNRASSSDDSDSRPIAVHIHHNPVIQALDSQGMDRVLQKHAGTLQKHFEGAVRRMNR